ncbi:hypothetical protein D778_02676 [Xanthomarina gelatinilytica]|uniref:Uncharacterized protein n=1 Tax=Xanthomarina gelatinilytica TaxID=1137281 RepID=M7N0V5_9FLAO|nr:hypothetical protein D778_02676 [Xanthomarina gelatinilytica]
MSILGLAISFFEMAVVSLLSLFSKQEVSEIAITPIIAKHLT